MSNNTIRYQAPQTVQILADCAALLCASAPDGFSAGFFGEEESELL